MKIKLNVNVDHVATIRQARKETEPDPIVAAVIAELAGASGIVAHLREDRRHIQDRDLFMLKKTLQTKLNMEMAITDEMLKIAEKISPETVTLVPENRMEITTEGGLDVMDNLERIKNAVKELKGLGIFVSLFVDSDYKQIVASRKAQADMVEIHTGTYANAQNEEEIILELNKIRESTQEALGCGLRVSAGHGLNYTNVWAVAQIDGIEELNIGHSIISRAVFSGMDKAVRDMLGIIQN